MPLLCPNRTPPQVERKDLPGGCTAAVGLIGVGVGVGGSGGVGLQAWVTSTVGLGLRLSPPLSPPLSLRVTFWLP